MATSLGTKKNPVISSDDVSENYPLRLLPVCDLLGGFLKEQQD